MQDEGAQRHNVLLRTALHFQDGALLLPEEEPWVPLAGH